MSGSKRKKGVFFECAAALAASLVFLFADQYTKHWAAAHLKEAEIRFIPDILSFSYVENRGMAWGMLSGRVWLFTSFTAVLLVFMGFLFIRLSMLGQRENKTVYLWLKADLVVLAAGALGNFTDRIRNGFVVDFIKTDFMDFPVFNVADCYVTVAVAVFFVLVLFFVKEEDLDLIFGRGS